ncbi:MAG: PDZ domain-containing protein [Bryobacteraceae bacterium]
MRYRTIIWPACLLAGAILEPGLPAQTPAPRAHSAGSFLLGKPSTYLGVGVLEIDADRAKALKLTEERGAEVTRLTDGGPAARAGMKVGDVILEYDGTPVQGTAQLQRLVQETPAGRQVKIVVWRNGASLTLTPVIEADRNALAGPGGDWNLQPFPMPDLPMVPPMDIPRIITAMQSGMLGVIGEPLGQQEQLAEFFGVKQGVLVKSVIRDSAAEKAGIKAGDVIVKIGDTPVATTQNITSALRGPRGTHAVTVTVVRNRKETPIPVTIGQPENPNHAGFNLFPRDIAPFDSFAVHPQY